jgi:hypothetical protein
MKEKIKRILDLIRAQKLSLEDAAPLLAALHPRLALTESDRELVASLLARGELDSAQVAEHLLLLRGVRDGPQPPPPPRAPTWEGRVKVGGRDIPIDMEAVMDRINDRVTAAMDRVGDLMGGEGLERGPQPARSGSARILRVQVESSDGDEYSANLPVSLAGHLHKLIPPHGIRALERAGLSIEALQLLIEADPPPGELIQAEDSDGNSVSLVLK